MSKIQEERQGHWRRLIAGQQQSGLSVQALREQHGTSEQSFHHWRKRLAQKLPVKFALVETNRSAPVSAAAVGLTLASGERLRIAPGVDAATLRLVPGVLREPR